MEHRWASLEEPPRPLQVAPVWVKLPGLIFVAMKN
jgi:hypothetical protein